MIDDTSVTPNEPQTETEGGPPATVLSDETDNRPGDVTVENYQHLQDAEHIRARPGMYIGDTTTSGLHHLVYELVYNSIDEAVAGYAKNIHVKINLEGSLAVSDDGRGIPVEIHPKAQIPVLEMIMTKTGSGAKFDNQAYKVSVGLHGMGAKAVTALSERTVAEIRRGGKVYVQEYERGKAITEVKEIGASSGRTGTKITFSPDPEIFKDRNFDFATLEDRLRELSYLNKGVKIILTDERSVEKKEVVFEAEGGIDKFVEYLNRDETPIHDDVIYMNSEFEDSRVEVAIQYTDGDQERIRCYANNGYNPDGGTHLTGFRTALTRTLGAYASQANAFKKDLKVEGVDYREGITAIVNVKLPNPVFESNNKRRLNTPETERAVASVVSEELKLYLEHNPQSAKTILQKVSLAAEAREAAAKARKAAKERKSILNSGSLPGKLIDCTKRNSDEAELFIVEGQSAGGTAASGRNPENQAILPLRGKVINVEKARLEKVLNNEEIRSLISAIGVDIENTETLDGLRYGKVVLLTDADVDGQHIRTLLLTFFYRQMQKLIQEGHIYVARPPLYKVTIKKKARFVQTAEEMEEELKSRGLDETKLHVTPVLNLVTGELGETKVFEGDELRAIVDVLFKAVLSGFAILERRGINLDSFLKRVDMEKGGAPQFHALFGGNEYWFYARDEMEAFRNEQAQALGHDLEVGDEMAGDGENNGASPSINELFVVQELREVRTVNEALKVLQKHGLSAGDLVPLDRIAGREPPQRFLVEQGDSSKHIPQLRDLVAEVRRLGEKGMSVTRFKGLGEMDDDELWDTTLDPEKRSLIRVKLEDAQKAEDMFRTLMGEKVEPRRDFINKHAIEATDVDFHGA
ncbi:MAG: DNA gyrase subunit B [Gemmataceae bacterium]